MVGMEQHYCRSEENGCFFFDRNVPALQVYTCFHILQLLKSIKKCFIIIIIILIRLEGSKRRLLAALMASCTTMLWRISTSVRGASIQSTPLYNEEE